GRALEPLDYAGHTRRADVAERDGGKLVRLADDPFALRLEAAARKQERGTRARGPLDQVLREPARVGNRAAGDLRCVADPGRELLRFSPQPRQLLDHGFGLDLERPQAGARLLELPVRDGQGVTRTHGRTARRRPILLARTLEPP